MLSQNNHEWAANISDTQSVDAARKLVVPMHLEALVIGKKNYDINWKSVAPDYKEWVKGETPPLGKFLQADICSDPVADVPYKPGIHLHWVLPRAYRHGVQDADDESPVFPLAPNRWLITRIAEKGKNIEIKRWVVESDYIHENGTEPNWLRMDKVKPSTTLKPGDKFKPIQIGKVYDYESWLQTGSKQDDKELFLTILSPCDPGFAANYSSCKNVFGFHDTLTNEQDVNTVYTYAITGWMSNPSKDILAGCTTGSDWVNKMKELSWEVSVNEKLPEGYQLPGGVLCHAILNDVRWEKGAVTRSSIPADGLNIAIGNTVSEALASLITEYTTTGFAEETNAYLSALQYNVMAEQSVDNGWNILNSLKATAGPGPGTRILMKQAHNRGFQASNGGSVWMLSKKEKPELLKSDDTDHNLPLQADASKLLEALNNAQHQCDDLLNTMPMLQGERYANWFKQELLSVNSKKRKKITAAAKSSLLSALQKDNERIETLLQQFATGDEDATVDDVKKKYTVIIDEKKKLLIKTLASDPAYKDYELKESKMPPYYHPNEPVVVIQGLEPSKIYSEKNTVLCRMEGQLIDTIHFEQPVDPKIVNADYRKLARDMGLSNKGLYPQVSLLFTETLALCPLLSAKAAAAVLGQSASTDKVTKLAAAITKILADSESSAGKFRNNETKAVLPLSYAREWRGKEQPWIPLMMEWEVEWVPAQTALDDKGMLSKWNFGAGSGKQKLNNIDYSLKSSLLKKGKLSAEKGISYKGRVALSADLTSRLNDMTNTFGKEIFSGIKPMYQSLSGLNQHMVMMETGIQLPPLKSKDGKYVVDDVVEKIEDQYLWNPVPEDRGFYPFRGGLFRLKNLFIIDAFGQNLPLINSNDDDENKNAKNSKPKMLVSSSMETTSGNENIALPPRICQPARLRFKWLSAADETTERETDTDPGTSPVCGWLLHNKIDKSLMVFNAVGATLGSLKLATDNSLRWILPPGIDGTANIDTNIPNLRLRNFVNSVYEAGKDTFKELLQQVDVMSQKAVKAKKAIAAGVGNLPLGTPIAVAGASCHLELKGLPPRNWSAKNSDSDLSKVNFPFFIGNNLSRTDGVICFYEETAGRNAAVKKLNLPFAQYIDNEKAKVVANEPLRLSVSKPLHPDAAGLTLLLHPYMDVTISSGILPYATYKLPAFNVSKALEQIGVSVMINPILTVGERTNIPVADIAGKQWMWLHKQNISKTETPEVLWQNDKLEIAKNSKLNYEPITAKEGWLKIDKKD
jgi:hypothetical protein